MTEKTYLLYSLADGSGVNPCMVKAKDKTEAALNYVIHNNGSVEDLLQLNEMSFDWAMQLMKEMEIVEVAEQSTKVPEKFIQKMYDLRNHYVQLKLEEHEKSELKRLSAKYNDSLRSN